MIFDPIAFGYAYGLVILSFGLGLIAATIMNVLNIGGKNAL